MKLDGKRALVTGGTRGIGAAIAVALNDAGATVIVCGSTEESVTGFAATNGIRAVCCDLSEPAEIESLAAAVDTRLGGLDILVNCAGVQRSMNLVEAPSADFEQEVQVNLLAPMRVTAALLPRLLAAPQAAVVNVTSIMALTPTQRAPVYGATKAGLASWTRSLRWQLESREVLVMELVPPLVATQMTTGRQQGAIEPREVAAACIDGLVRERPDVRVGKAKTVHLLERFAPGLVARLVRHR
ncbi:MAG: SDR family NAD(P)-dependent oxidoreductase [Deltaproteobacteria bacterium]